MNARRARSLPAFLFLCVGCFALLGAGCATRRDVNPNVPATGFGYVDLYTVPKSAAWWKVDVFDSTRQSYKEFTAQFQAPGEDIFRVQARPGPHKARISLVNQAIEEPAEVEVEVREGMITPVKVTLVPGDKTYVRVVDDRAKVKYRNKVTDYSQTRLRLTAAAEPPVAYAPKQAMNYWK